MENKQDPINEKELYMAALTKWGPVLQMTLMFEEMSELQKELCKSLRGKDTTENIVEEIADVEIMLEQMKLLFEIDKAVEVEKNIKIKRLDTKIKEDTRSCRICGCTNLYGCPEGCWWVEYDLCSSCLDKK